jgi:hypothetical protein
MLMDIVKSIIVSQDDFDLAGEILDGTDLLQVATDVKADVVVVGGFSAAETKYYGDLLYSLPRLKIIAIATDGRAALLHELQPHVIPLDEVAAISLIAAIRGKPDPIAGSEVP